MTGMIKRILDVSGKYKSRIYGAMFLSFLKGMLMKVPAVVTFMIVTAFIEGGLTKKACVYAAVALVGSVAVQAVFQYISDRLQSAAAPGKPSRLTAARNRRGMRKALQPRVLLQQNLLQRKQFRRIRSRI